MIFLGWWSATPKLRGQSKKTEGLTALKIGGSSLPEGGFKELVPPPPLPPGAGGRVGRAGCR